MSDVDLYIGRTATAAYALLYEDTPYPTSTKPLDYFGPFADVIKTLREFHEQVAQLSAKNGKAYDVWTDARSIWEGMRSSDDGHKRYGLLDHALRELGTLMTDEKRREPPIAQQVATSGRQLPAKQTEYVTDWRPSVVSAADLRKRVFPNLVWLVDGIVPEGACILAGKPKTKKSWLALSIAVAVAYGSKAFSYYDVTKGRVLYLDLESNQRRMQSRLRAIISEQAAWPDNFDIATDWKRGDEGIALLDAYCTAHSDTRLIVIDIWAKFRARRDPKADAYEQDYDALQALNAWAEARRVTVIVIHHTRKAKADNIFEEISGTMAITGAVATAMVLARSPDVPEEQILHFEGRDQIEDDPIALKWDAYTCQHVYVATGAEASSSAQRRHILEVMDDEEEYQVKDLARLVGKTSMRALDNQLRRLLDDNLIARTGRGMYAKVIKASGDSRDSGLHGDGGEGGKFSSKISTGARGVDKGVESGLGLSEALEGTLHTLHDDSISTPINTDSLPDDYEEL